MSDFLSLRGERWTVIAMAVRQRDGNTCRRCGETATSDGRSLPVHHIVHEENVGEEEDPHDPENLVTVCPGCHREVEGENVGRQLEELGLNSQDQLRFDRETLEWTNTMLTRLGRKNVGRGVYGLVEDPREREEARQ